MSNERVVHLDVVGFPDGHHAIIRPFESLHQIELTSKCNLRCAYCPSPVLPRPKLDMSMEHFERALAWVRYFVARDTQDSELNLAGIGESTLRGDLPLLVARAREALGDERTLCFTTNGLLFDDKLARALYPYNVKVGISLHRPEKAALAIEVAEKYGMLYGVSSDPATRSINWAGQVKWRVHEEAKGSPCPWIHLGWGMAMADGRLTHCCLDASGAGSFGDVTIEPRSDLMMSTSALCSTCHHAVSVPGREQSQLRAAPATEYTKLVQVSEGSATVASGDSAPEPEGSK